MCPGGCARTVALFSSQHAKCRQLKRLSPHMGAHLWIADPEQVGTSRLPEVG